MGFQFCQFDSRNGYDNYMMFTLLALNVTVRTNAFFGLGDGPIFLDHVSCTGREERLLDCPNSGLEVGSCSHNQDAGVVCVTGNCQAINML